MNLKPDEEAQPYQKQIDEIIANIKDWRGIKLSQLREIIRQADPDLVEEVKWKKPSKPEGVPVWSHNGIMCVADTLKDAVRLTFPNGAQLDDENKIFNARLDSNKIRAVDYFQDSMIDTAALTSLIRYAGDLNLNKTKK